jgi:hypothetical protein
MKYCLILFMILFGTCSNAQSENSFYVKNKNDGEVKKVYFIGDRIKLLYVYSGDSFLKVKGIINEISENKIKVNDKWIEVSRIRGIISHGFIKTCIGSLGLAISAGVVYMKRNTTESQPSIFTQEEIIGFAVFPIIISSAAVLLIPMKYRPEKFVFKTYLVPKK